MDRIAPAAQPSCHSANPIERRGGVWLIKPAHHLDILGAGTDGLIVPIPPRQPQQRTLRTQAQPWMARFHKLLLLLAREHTYILVAVAGRSDLAAELISPVTAP